MTTTASEAPPEAPQKPPPSLSKNNSLKAPEPPCEKERKQSLNCIEKHYHEKDRHETCTAFFDNYKECKKRFIEARNLKNNAGKPQTFF